MCSQSFFGGGSYGVTTFSLTPLACGNVACAAVDDTRSVSSSRSGGSGAYPKLFVLLRKIYTSLGKKLFHLTTSNFFMGHIFSFGRTMVSTKKQTPWQTEVAPASQDNTKLQRLLFPCTSVQQDEELESQISHSAVRRQPPLDRPSLVAANDHTYTIVSLTHLRLYHYHTIFQSALVIASVQGSHHETRPAALNKTQFLVRATLRSAKEIP